MQSFLCYQLKPTCSKNWSGKRKILISIHDLFFILTLTQDLSFLGLRICENGAKKCQRAIKEVFFALEEIFATCCHMWNENWFEGQSNISEFLLLLNIYLKVLEKGSTCHWRETWYCLFFIRLSTFWKALCYLFVQ